MHTHTHTSPRACPVSVWISAGLSSVSKRLFKVETVFCLCCSLLMRDPHELSEGQMAAEFEVQYLLEEGRRMQMEVKARVSMKLERKTANLTEEVERHSAHGTLQLKMLGAVKAPLSLA